MAYLSKYGVARKIRIPMVKRGVVDHAVGADWTPATGDVKISKDGGATANITTLPTAIAMGNSAIWEFPISATEMQAAQVNVTIADTATKAVEDSAFDLETYGHASGQHQVDLADSVRAGLTALPNAAANAAGGLPISAAGALDLDEMNVDIEAIETATTAAAIRAAVGLASANLDTQLTTIDDFLDTEIAAILVATTTTLDDYVDDLELRLTAALATALQAHSLGIGRLVVDAGSSTTTVVFKTVNGAGASATDDFYKGRSIVFTSGALLLQATSISSYTGATKTATVPTLTGTPADNVTAVIV